MEKNYNKVFIPFSGLFEKKQEDNITTFKSNYHSFPYLVEELIALSATEILVIGVEGGTKLKQGIPKLLHNKITVINPEEVDYKVNNILFPISDQLDAYQQNSHGIIESETYVIRSVKRALGHAAYSVKNLVYGIKYKSQIDIDIAMTKQSLAVLRSFTTDKNTRGILSALLGFLNSYATYEVGNIRAISSVDTNYVNRLMDLIDDADFLSLSAENYNLGIPGKMMAAIVSIKRKIRDAFYNYKNRGLISAGSKLVSAAAELPIDPGEVIGHICQGKFAPPIVSLSAVYNGARDEYYKTHHLKLFGPEACPLVRGIDAW